MDVEASSQREQLQRHIADELAGVQLLPGTFITGLANMTTRAVHLAWIMDSDLLWRGTGKLGSLTTGQLIADLASLVLASDEFTWEIVGVDQ